MSTFNHPERRAGEYYLMNATREWLDAIEIPFRKGRQAYMSDGSLSDLDIVPIFVDAKRYLEWIATAEGKCCLYGTTIRTPASEGDLADLREDVAAQLALEPLPETLHAFKVDCAVEISDMLQPDAIRRLLEVPGFDGISPTDGETFAVASATRMAPECPEFNAPSVPFEDDSPKAMLLRKWTWDQYSKLQAWRDAYCRTAQKELADIVKQAIQGKGTPQ